MSALRLSDLDSTDLFCGAGGSGIGARAAGIGLRIAANHWRLAVDTHQVNFPDTDHDCADISQANPRRYPRTALLWGSPECTNHTGAKGKRRPDSQPGLFDTSEPDPSAERSRATMWDIPRFAEHHLYEAVMVENVVEAARWALFPAWLHAMELLGYEHHIVYLNSMHAPAQKAPRAPQSRDRMYVVFWRKGNPRPDLEPRPLAWCDECGEVVGAVQWWKNGVRWGKYRAQYLYRCPNVTCKNAVVEPFADPAASIIDWSMPGQRIGDRAKPLSDKTMARIQAGLERYAGRPLTFEARGNTFVRTGRDGRPVYARAWPVDQPTATLTTSETRALVVPMEGRDGVNARPATEVLRAQTTRHQDALVVPYYGGTKTALPSGLPLPTQGTIDTCGLAFIAELRGGHSDARHVTEPLASVTASGNHHMLVRHNTARGNPAQMCTPATEPARTITTAGHQSIVGWPDVVIPAVEDCSFRMLEPSEIGAAMAFTHDYEVLGSRRDQVKQYGNAVTPPASEWLYRQVGASLGAIA